MDYVLPVMLTLTVIALLVLAFKPRPVSTVTVRQLIDKAMVGYSARVLNKNDAAYVLLYGNHIISRFRVPHRHSILLNDFLCEVAEQHGILAGSYVKRLDEREINTIASTTINVII